MSQTISNLITDFLEYMEIEKGRAASSAKNYDHYLKHFAYFAKENGVTDPEEITSDLVTKYRLYANRQAKPVSKKTQNYYLIALRSFLKYLARRDITTLAAGKIELAKVDERQIGFLNDDELDLLLDQPDQKTIHGQRDRAILDLFFSTGLRVSELCNLKQSDINLERSEFSVKGKGGKVRVVFLDEAVKESLDKYLKSRRDDSDYLFISYGHTNKQIRQSAIGIRLSAGGKRNAESGEQSQGMTPRSVQRMIKKYALAGGITKDVTPHVMRHTFATDLLYSGSDLRAVQTLLGHKNVSTTEIYTHVTNRNLKEVHQAFHGLRTNKDSKSDKSD